MRFGTAVASSGGAGYNWWYRVHCAVNNISVPLTYSTNSLVDSTNFANVICRNSGAVVTLRVQVTTTTTSGGTAWTTIGTIPAGYRPSEWYYRNCFNESNTFSRGGLRVGTAGEIQIYKNNTTAMTIRESLSWINVI